MNETIARAEDERDLHADEERAIEEKNALDKKIGEYNRILEGEMEHADRERLFRQRLYMVCYSNVLLERVQAFNHPGALRMLSYPEVWTIK